MVCSLCKQACLPTLTMRGCRGEYCRLYDSCSDARVFQKATCRQEQQAGKHTCLLEGSDGTAALSQHVRAQL